MSQKGFLTLSERSKSKGFAGIIILIVVLILAGLGGAYYFVKSQAPKPQSQNQVVVSQIPQPTPVPVQSPNETVNWKTYMNTKYHYSIKYPYSWFICNSDDAMIFINSQQTDCSSAGLNDVSIFVDDKSDLTAQFELKKSNALKLSQIKFAGAEASKSAETGNIYIFSGNYLYTVNGWIRLNPNTSNVENINQILSTFKFIP